MYAHHDEGRWSCQCQVSGVAVTWGTKSQELRKITMITALVRSQAGVGGYPKTVIDDQHTDIAKLHHGGAIVREAHPEAAP